MRKKWGLGKERIAVPDVLLQLEDDHLREAFVDARESANQTHSRLGALVGAYSAVLVALSFSATQLHQWKYVTVVSGCLVVAVGAFIVFGYLHTPKPHFYLTAEKSRPGAVKLAHHEANEASWFLVLATTLLVVAGLTIAANISHSIGEQLKEDQPKTQSVKRQQKGPTGETGPSAVLRPRD